MNVNQSKDREMSNGNVNFKAVVPVIVDVPPKVRIVTKAKWDLLPVSKRDVKEWRELKKGQFIYRKAYLEIRTHLTTKPNPIIESMRRKLKKIAFTESVKIVDNKQFIVFAAGQLSNS